MSTICTRCALRIQRAAQTDTHQAAKRAFSQSTTRRKHHGLPIFQDVSTPELTDVLISMRTKHLIPAYLTKSERRLIFGTKNKQLLADNPRTTLIGDEEVPLKWIDRRTEIPNRTKLFNQAIALMAKGETGKDWQNLPALLKGMRNTGAKLGEETLGTVVRKAANAGRLGVIIQCLQQVEHTGLTLKDDTVLQNVVWALRDMAQKDEWSEEATGKAMKWAGEVGGLMEREEHGGGRRVREGDARKRPEVIGVFLELAAVQAYKHAGGKDTDGKVRIYTERLLACVGEQSQPLSHAPASGGPQFEMLHGVPIWHGLRLAEKVLGSHLPQPQQARKIREDYQAGLTILAQAIEAQRPMGGSYGEQALRVWGGVGCIKD